jgi:hypothetical protein
MHETINKENIQTQEENVYMNNSPPDSPVKSKEIGTTDKAVST